MEAIGRMFTYIIDGMRQTFIIYGYEISMWQIFVFSFVGGIVCHFIGGLINGD